MTALFLQLTSGQTAVHGQQGAWGVYLVKCNNGKSWKRPDSARGSFFLPLSDITEILDDYTMQQDGRTIFFTFPHV